MKHIEVQEPTGLSAKIIEEAEKQRESLREFRRSMSVYNTYRRERAAIGADWATGPRQVFTFNPTGLVLPVGPLVYAISDGDGFHKIGKAVNVAKRIKELQIGNARRLFMVCYLPCRSDSEAMLAERRAQKALGGVRAFGEWFCCNSHYAFQSLHEASFFSNGRGRPMHRPIPVDVCVGHDDE